MVDADLERSSASLKEVFDGKQLGAMAIVTASGTVGFFVGELLSDAVTNTIKKNPETLVGATASGASKVAGAILLASLAYMVESPMFDVVAIWMAVGLLLSAGISDFPNAFNASQA